MGCGEQMTLTGERQVLRTHGQATYLLTEQLLEGEMIHRISSLGEYTKYLEVACLIHYLNLVSVNLKLICIADGFSVSFSHLRIAYNIITLESILADLPDLPRAYCPNPGLQVFSLNPGELLSCLVT